MGLRINTNPTSLAAQRTLGTTNRNQASLLGKLSSCHRITKAADDSAGLAISSKLRAAIRGTSQANRNANDGISLIQTAEGGLNEISNILIRLRELAIQTSSDTIGDSERQFADLEYQNLKQEVDRIAQSTEFNGKKILNPEGSIYDFQVGIRNNPFEDRISYDSSLVASDLETLKIGDQAVTSKESSQESLQPLDDAIQLISGKRAVLGATQNRLMSTIQNLQINHENLSAANSRILDTDYAEASSENVRLNILQSAGVAVLGQANTRTQLAIKLIG